MVNKHIYPETRYYRYSFTVAVNTGEIEDLRKFEDYIKKAQSDIYGAAGEDLSHDLVFNKDEIDRHTFLRENGWEISGGDFSLPMEI